MLATLVAAARRFPHPKNPQRTVLLGALLLIAGLTLGFTLTRLGAAATGELALDQRIALRRTDPGILLSLTIELLLGPLVGTLVVIMGCIAVALFNWRAALTLAMTTFIAWGSVAIGKVVVLRPRPPTLEVDAVLRVSGLTSYPSGHTALAAGLVAGTVLALRVWKKPTLWAWLIGVPFVLLVAWSRLYLGLHYLGDVVGAVIFVVGAVWLAWGGVALFANRHPEVAQVSE